MPQKITFLLWSLAIFQFYLLILFSHVPWDICLVDLHYLPMSFSIPFIFLNDLIDMRSCCNDRSAGKCYYGCLLKPWVSTELIPWFEMEKGSSWKEIMSLTIHASTYGIHLTQTPEQVSCCIPMPCSCVKCCNLCSADNNTNYSFLHSGQQVSNANQSVYCRNRGWFNVGISKVVAQS